MTNYRPLPNGAQTVGNNLKPLVQALDNLVDAKSYLPELILTDEAVAEIQKTFTVVPLTGNELFGSQSINDTTNDTTNNAGLKITDQLLGKPLARFSR